ncbi:MAG: DUF6778 family protein [Pseudomonadota bacterium]
MARVRNLALSILIVALAACAPGPRNAPDTLAFASIDAPDAATPAPSYSVRAITVDVPLSLRISEANTYYPFADIVWRGDPMGDRRRQLKAIFETAFSRGTQSMRGGQEIILDVRLKRFHALSDRVRLSVGGAHHIVFDLALRDAETGILIAPAREVNVRLKALGGMQAVRAERRGQTQKVRIIGFLARLIQQELGQPVTL